MNNHPFPKLAEFCAEYLFCDITLTRYDENEKSIVLSQIISKKPGNGYGTACMWYLLSRFRDMGIRKVSLVVQPIDSYCDLDERQISDLTLRLQKWYERLGFRVIKACMIKERYLQCVEMEKEL